VMDPFIIGAARWRARPVRRVCLEWRNSAAKGHGPRSKRFRSSSTARFWVCFVWRTSTIIPPRAPRLSRDSNRGGGLHTAKSARSSYFRTPRHGSGFRAALPAAGMTQALDLTRIEAVAARTLAAGVFEARGYRLNSASFTDSDISGQASAVPLERGSASSLRRDAVHMTKPFFT